MGWRGNVRFRIALALGALLAALTQLSRRPDDGSPLCASRFGGAQHFFSSGSSRRARRLFSPRGIGLQNFVPIPGGSDKMIDALHDDTVDITHVAVAFEVRAALTTSDAVAIAAEFNNPIYSLIAKPEIKCFADLKGKLLGMADEAGTITISTRKLLTLHGLSAGDFRVKPIEGTPTPITA